MELMDKIKKFIEQAQATKHIKINAHQQCYIDGEAGEHTPQDSEIYRSLSPVVDNIKIEQLEGWSYFIMLRYEIEGTVEFTGTTLRDAKITITQPNGKAITKSLAFFVLPGFGEEVTITVDGEEYLFEDYINEISDFELTLID